MRYRVVQRFAAALTEDKLKELMLKIRKGATASLTWKQLAEVLAALDPGWKLEKMVGLVRLFYTSADYPKDEVQSWHGHESFYNNDKNVVEAQHRAFAADAVTSLPSKPKHGQLYILDLTDIQPGNHNDWTFTFKPWTLNSSCVW